MDMFGLDGQINDALKQIQSGFDKLKMLAIANLILSGSLFIYVWWRKR